MYKQPQSVLVVIYTADLQVLLLERADRAGYWQSVTGSCEAGESLLDTARREVQEETGIQAEAHDLQDWHTSACYEIYPYWRHRYAPGVAYNTEYLFGLRVPYPVAVTLSPAEHTAYQWMDRQTAQTLVFSWTNVAALRLLDERFREWGG